MAADTEPPPATQPAPEVTPLVTKPDAPKNTADIRGTLGRGMRQKVQAAAGLFPQAQPATPIAPQPTEGVVSEQQLQPLATDAAAKPSPEETTPPAAPAAAAPVLPALEPPATGTATVLEAAPPEQAAPPPTPAKPDLPPEYVAREYQERFAQDPLLRGELLRIWRQTDLSDVAKTRAMERRVIASDQRIGAALASQQKLADLRHAGNLEEWAKQVDETEAQAEQKRQWAVGVTRLLAQTLGVDPSDDGFINAGAVGPGEPEELRASRFAEWVAANSPVAKAHWTPLLEAAKANETAALATQQAQHEQTVKQLNSEWERKLEAATAAALAQGRGTQAVPPRAGGITAETETQPFRPPQSLRDVRGLLGAGLRLRQEAARPSPPGS